MYFTGWQKKKGKKTHITTPILKLTYDQKTETFCGCYVPFQFFFYYFVFVFLVNKLLNP